MIKLLVCHSRPRARGRVPASQRRIQRVRTLVSVGLVLLSPLTTRAVSFTFALSQGSRTSAGVFAADGTLVKTLWGGVPYAAGRYAKEWDGTDDAGHLAPDGKYQVRVLTSHCTYSWEGAVGNTSDACFGPNVFHFMGTINSLAITGTNAYLAAGYNEGLSSQARFSTGAIGARYYAFASAGAMFTKVATDGTNIYWGGFDPCIPNHDEGFVMATKVGTDTETIFASGRKYPCVYGNLTFSSAIDVVTKTVGAEPSGLAVQRLAHGTAHKSYLFVARQGSNSLHVIDKTTGDLVQSLSYPAPGDLAVDDHDNLWMLYNGTVQHFTVNLDPAGSFASLTPGVTLRGLVHPLTLACDRTGNVLVADGETPQQSSQQVKAFDAAGAALWTLGQPGGYNQDPTVANDKFDLQSTNVPFATVTFLACQPDGSFWVGDSGDYRVQHFSATRTFLDRIAYVPAGYSAGVDPNNPTRVFADFLEYAVDYSLPLGGTNGSWRLIRNWGRGVPAPFGTDMYSRLKYVTTLRNGRTYAILSGPGADPFTLFELPPTGLLRNTGIKFPYYGSLYPDGSIRTVTTTGKGNAPGTETWHQRTLTGFDDANNPVWGATNSLATIPVATTDPRDMDGGGANVAVFRAGPMTTGGVLISYDTSHYPNADHGHGWHLGGVRPGGSNWLWKASYCTPSHYKPWPTDGSFSINSGYAFLGGPVMTVDRHIFCQFVSAGSANKFSHYYEDGLFVDSFGWWAADGGGDSPAQAAIDCFSCWLVKLSDGRVFMYHNDAACHGGVNRWRIDGLDTVAEQKIPVRWRQRTRPGLQAEYFNTPDWNNRYRVTARIDTQVNFDWGTNSPSGTGVTGSSFSTRWTGYVVPQSDGTNSFTAVAADFARVWVDGRLVLAGAGTQTGAVVLTAGVYYPIKVEYKNNAGAAGLVLKWSSASLPEEIIPAKRLACVPGVGVSNPADLLSGLWSDSELTTGTNGDYGWSWSPAPKHEYWHSWYARTNMKTMQRSPPVDLGICFGDTNTTTAALSRDLGVPSDATTQWEIATQLNFDGNTQNQGAPGGQYLDVLDDAGKVIARFYAAGIGYPADYRVYGNTALIAKTDVTTLNSLMGQWQPFRITAKNGQITFQYGPYPPITTTPHDTAANWRRAKTLRLSYWSAPGGGYGRAIALDDLTFTTSQ